MAIAPKGGGEAIWRDPAETPLKDVVAAAPKSKKGPAEKKSKAAPLSEVPVADPVLPPGDAPSEWGPAFLLQVDFATHAWLKTEQVRRGLRSRSETIRTIFTEVRVGQEEGR